MQRCIDPSGKTAILAVLTKPLSLFFILIHQLCKVFCWNSASKFPSSLMSISSSCKLIKRCYIFIFLANRFWNTLFENKIFFKQVRNFCFQVFRVYVHRNCYTWDNGHCFLAPESDSHGKTRKCFSNALSIALVSLGKTVYLSVIVYISNKKLFADVIKLLILTLKLDHPGLLDGP